ncbi:MAG: MATE family efflux transporter [Planctomycetes bacterium]|nr:MATE family efflux transporter [Planctomycetota bacterium]
MSTRAMNSKPAFQSPTIELLYLAGPIILMMVSRMLMGFIDFVMVSELGTVAQAAISPATIFVFGLACLGMGVAQAVQTFVSQTDGRGEPEQAGSYGWQTLYIAGLCGLITWPVAQTTPIWYGWVAQFANHAPEMARLEIEYTQIALWSVPASVVSVGLNGFFMGVQRPRVTLLAMVASLVVNAVGNYALIFGHFGFPELGIAGAAIATVIGWLTRAAVLAGAMLLPRYDRRYNTRRSFAFSARKFVGLLRVGGPTSIQWLVDIGSWTAFLAFIMPGLGLSATAASNVGLQYMHLSFMPAVGLGLALCSQVGFAIGEGRPDVAVQRTRVALGLTAGYMGAIGVLFLVAGRPLMGLLSDDPAVIDLGVSVLIWAAVFQAFDAMSITYMNALRGAGDTRWPAVMIGITCWGVFIGGGYLMARLVPQWGLNGPWMMCTTYIILLGCLLAGRWRGDRWRRIRLFGDTDSGTADQSTLADAAADDDTRDLALAAPPTVPTPAD